MCNPFCPVLYCMNCISIINLPNIQGTIRQRVFWLLLIKIRLSRTCIANKTAIKWLSNHILNTTPKRHTEFFKRKKGNLRKIVSFRILLVLFDWYFTDTFQQSPWKFKTLLLHLIINAASLLLPIQELPFSLLPLHALPF